LKTLIKKNAPKSAVVIGYFIVFATK